MSHDFIFCGRQDFFIKPRYENTLPDIPCDPKHILMPLNPNRFDLSPPEQISFYEQLADWNCGVSLDLVGSTLNWKPGRKAPSASLELDPKDQLLLEDDNSKGIELKSTTNVFPVLYHSSYNLIYNLVLFYRD